MIPIKNAGQSRRSSFQIQPLRSQQLPQNKRQNPAVLVVIHFDRRIDAQQDFDVLRFAVLAVDDQRGFLLRLDVAFDAFQVEGFIAGDA